MERGATSSAAKKNGKKRSRHRSEGKRNCPWGCSPSAHTCAGHVYGSASPKMGEEK